MPSETKAGLVSGIVGVLTIAVVFFSSEQQHSRCDPASKSIDHAAPSQRVAQSIVPVKRDSETQGVPAVGQPGGE